MTELDPKLTFDTFVVGPANRLAAAAARRAADAPGAAYNPLFIYSASGLGKSHIMNALAHQAGRTNPNARVLYQTTEALLEDLAGALSRGGREEFRQRYEGLDVFLLDDVQFLTGQAEAQEILLRTLDALSASGKQIALASDRPPAEINGLDARLVSRFSGGLMVDIGPPEYETRVAIMRRKAEQRGVELEAGVAETVARFPFRNVRELQGGLNRILAIQELEGRPVGLPEANRILAALEAAAEAGGASSPSEGTVAPEVESGSAGSSADEVDAQAAGEEGEAGEAPWVARLRSAAEEAEAQGYSARRFRHVLDSGEEPDDLDLLMATFQEDVERLRDIRDALNSAGNPWPEAAGVVLKDPDRIAEAENLLDSARERARPFPELDDGPQLHQLEGLFPNLALRAAEQLVSLDDPDYNPVVLVCEDPGYAVNLMEAAGRSFKAERPDGVLAITSAEDFAREFIRALGEGVAGAWRERWWSADLLLLMGAEELGKTERAQDEFFHLYEALARRGARILVAGRCAPAAMEGIDERLRSRFESGLVVDLGPGEEDDGDFGLPSMDLAPGLAPPKDSPEPRSLQERIQQDSGPDPSAVIPGDNETLIPPLDELQVGEGGLGGFFFGGSDSAEGGEETSARSEEAWFPSPEKVIWEWPSLEDLLVEEVD